MSLEASIAALTQLLKTKALSPQEDKEVRAELEVLIKELKIQNDVKLSRLGMSLYGSYFDTTS